ncbi:hypothetical protein L210DRAFT_3502648 [Boletus edulis BED1]|uniref:Uncharacterized protein n=1 Tax=Boletus edulis BED1 TaxID=1328754 RepID=A0AAD4C004_BOLED|nr:hypothetical protein L210DRAFT_3502648 [Boletus edulis BED1]
MSSFNAQSVSSPLCSEIPSMNNDVGSPTIGTNGRQDTTQCRKTVRIGNFDFKPVCASNAERSDMRAYVVAVLFNVAASKDIYEGDRNGQLTEANERRNHINVSAAQPHRQTKEKLTIAAVLLSKRSQLEGTASNSISIPLMANHKVAVDVPNKSTGTSTHERERFHIVQLRSVSVKPAMHRITIQKHILSEIENKDDLHM